MVILANWDDPDERLHKVAFSQDLHCLLRQKKHKKKTTQFILENMTCVPSIYIMDHPNLTVSNFMENSIGL